MRWSLMIDHFFLSQLPSDGSPLNKEWIQKRLEDAIAERTKLHGDKKFSNNKVLKNKVLTVCFSHSHFHILPSLTHYLFLCLCPLFLFYFPPFLSLSCRRMFYQS